MLQALEANNPDPGLAELKHQLSTLSKKSDVLQWIPAHCWVKGNDKADELAKEGRQLDQPPTKLTYREA